LDDRLVLSVSSHPQRESHVSVYDSICLSPMRTPTQWLACLFRHTPVCPPCRCRHVESRPTRGITCKRVRFDLSVPTVVAALQRWLFGHTPVCPPCRCRHVESHPQGESHVSVYDSTCLCPLLWLHSKDGYLDIPLYVHHVDVVMSSPIHKGNHM
jgi:hypothetical protein